MQLHRVRDDDEIAQCVIVHEENINDENNKKAVMKSFTTQ